MFLAAFVVLLLFVTDFVSYSRSQKEQSPCPTNTTLCDGRCYFTSKYKIGWGSAAEVCKVTHENADLVILDDKRKDQSVRDCLLQGLITTEKELWIDGIFDEISKKWNYGKTGLPLKHQTFSRRRPEDDAAWKCIAMNKEVLYRWSSMDCFSEITALCEINV